MSVIAKNTNLNIMKLLPQFNPDDYPDSPRYEPLLQMHTPSKVSKCEATEVQHPVNYELLHDQSHGFQFLGCRLYQVRCPRMESNFRPPLFEQQRGSQAIGISKFGVPSWSRTFALCGSTPVPEVDRQKQNFSSLVT